MSYAIAPARLTDLDPDRAAELLREACRARLAPSPPPAAAPVLDRVAIEALLPHRDPFLFVERVDLLDPAAGVIVARAGLGSGAAILAGHFPGRPVWPGVLQVEAIAQAGCVLCASIRGEPLAEVAATHILGARFTRPVLPGAPVEVAATVSEDGLFFTVIGQCLQDNEICSAAVLSAYVG